GRQGRRVELLARRRADVRGDVAHGHADRSASARRGNTAGRAALNARASRDVHSPGSTKPALAPLASGTAALPSAGQPLNVAGPPAPASSLNATPPNGVVARFGP